ITSGILPMEETRRMAREHVRQGFRRLKIKGGLDVALDVERMHALRQDLGPDVLLAFDANQGFNAADARRFLDGTASVGLAFFEQPLPKADTLGLAALAQTYPTSNVMADEPIKGPADLQRLAQAGAPRLANLKLMKC